MLEDLDPKWVRLAPNWTYLGLFNTNIRFQVYFGPVTPEKDVYEKRYPEQDGQKTDLKKTRICPTWCQSNLFWVQIWHHWSTQMF